MCRRATGSSRTTTTPIRRRRTRPTRAAARFLDPIDFDALGWGVPPSTIPATDTSQLLALIVAQKVLEDAAREQFETLDRSRISVILGVTERPGAARPRWSSRLQRPVWVKALRESGLPEDEVTGDLRPDRRALRAVAGGTFPGLLGNVVAGRIANRLEPRRHQLRHRRRLRLDASARSRWRSPSCSSAHSDLVIAGGVDTLNDIFMYMCFSKTPALSPSGDCRPVQRPGRRHDARRGARHGRAQAPRRRRARRRPHLRRDPRRRHLLRRALQERLRAGRRRAGARRCAAPTTLAGYGPETVELVEAHGTGTKAGDVAEFEGLRMVFDERADGQTGSGARSAR